MKNRRTIEILQTIAIISLIIFGLVIVYQIIKKIAGGSWSTENIIISLLIFEIGFAFTIAISQIKNNIKLNYLSGSFRHLANDFKLHLHDNK